MVGKNPHYLNTGKKAYLQAEEETIVLGSQEGWLRIPLKVAELNFKTGI